MLALRLDLTLCATALAVLLAPDLTLAQAPASPVPELKLFHAVSPSAQHPTAHVAVPPGYKLIGGGARVNWNGAGNLLTASYPDGDGWSAAAKDYDIPSPATIDVWAVALFDPGNAWDVITRTSTSEPDHQPYAEVTLPAGYEPTGGGARADYRGAGSMLTCMGFLDAGWFARASDHIHPDPASVTAYAIGIRQREGGASPAETRSYAVSKATNHPALSLTAGGAPIVGGGACTGAIGDTAASSSHNYLTASYPGPGLQSWSAAAKDHQRPYPTSLAVTVIALPEARIAP